MTAQVERVRTSGIFSIDGEDFEVENNIWLYGDDTEVLIVDGPHFAIDTAANEIATLVANFMSTLTRRSASASPNNAERPRPSGVGLVVWFIFFSLQS